MINKITSNDLSAAIENNGIVIFSAEWCGSCHALLQRIEPLSDALNGKVYNADVDENEDLSVQYHVKTLPCIIIFNNGEVVDRIDNNINFQDLINKIRNT